MSLIIVPNEFHDLQDIQITSYTSSADAKAQADAVNLQKELQSLTENLSKLNKIYVGMYDAMHK